MSLLDKQVKNELSTVENLTLSKGLVLKIMTLIDLTSLNEGDTLVNIIELTKKAISPLAHVAAVCVLPPFVDYAARVLAETGVKIATVVNFPAGDARIEKTLIEILEAIQNGANEIDVVFPYRDFLTGNQASASDFIKQCKLACGSDVLLKVILETGVLPDLNSIADISDAAILAGADFIKTSTGKTSVGATLEAAAVMLMSIQHMTPIVKRTIGLKVSGGIRHLEQAVQYIALTNRLMGIGWLSPKTFRFGASQLLDEVLRY